MRLHHANHLSSGINEATFRIDRCHDPLFGVGAVPLSAGYMPYCRDVTAGYMLYSEGVYRARSSDFWEPTARFGASYGAGDKITVIVDLVANTVAFRKNGVEGASFSLSFEVILVI